MISSGRPFAPFAALIALCAMAPGAASGQSSSLYVKAEPSPVREERGRLVPTEMQAMSWIAVAPPLPRKFQMQDLVTIIIREQSTATIDGALETEKEYDLSVDTKVFPSTRLSDLLNFSLGSSNRNDDGFPDAEVGAKREFTGEGEYERRDELVTRLTARVIDIKPNGLLVLEARTYIQNDEEQLLIQVTGTCRPDDVTPTNTVLSTQMWNLHVKKTHEGSVRKASKKGFITQILDTIFNF